MVQRWQRNTVHFVDALLAFVAALIALRLSGDLVRRYRARRRPELAAWAAGLAAYALAAGALAWGAAAGWSEAAFRVYYLGGGLLTAALLGAGSLLLVGRRWVTPVALVYIGLAVGVAIAAPLQTELAGTEIPEAQDVLELWPARILAILGNSLGTLAVVVVAHRDVPRAPARQRLDPRGDRGRGDRKRPRRARRRSASARGRSRRRAPLRRVRGPGAAREATPRRARRPPRGRSTPR